MQPKLILFDLDGTLIDSVPDLAIALDQTLAFFGLKAAGEDQTRLWVGNGAAALIQRALQHSLDDDDKVKAYQEEALLRFFEYYQQCSSRHTRLYPHVAETLEKLKQKAIVMAVVTNKPKIFVAPILQSLNIDHYFVMIVGGDELPEKKPHPLPLIHCMGALGYNAGQTLMVGDSKHDIHAAKAADIMVAAVNYGYNHGRPIENEKPDYVMSSFNQILLDVLDD